MNNDSKFERLSSIYDEMVFQNQFRQGSLLLKNESIFENLKECLVDYDVYGLSTILNIDKFNIGDTVLLERGEPLPRIGHFYINFKEFLSSENLVKFPRKSFYLLEEKLSSSNENIENLNNFIRYKMILEFINEVLIPSAIYFDKDSHVLIYLDTKKIEIPVKYNIDDLISLDIDMLQQIRGKFYKDTHREQKLSIISESLKNLCVPISKNFRFKHLLENLSDLNKSFDNGYKLFVANFSYEKIKDDIETAKIEEMTKIHKVISDVQNHILGIPIATIIVGTQMKVATDSMSQIVINTCVLVGALFFTLLVSFIMGNQKDTLEILKTEIDRKKNVITQQYTTVEDIIKPDFKILYGRIEFQRIVLNTVIGVVWGGFFLTVVTFFILSFYIKGK